MRSFPPTHTLSRTRYNDYTPLHWHEGFWGRIDYFRIFIENWLQTGFGPRKTFPRPCYRTFVATTNHLSRTGLGNRIFSVAHWLGLSNGDLVFQFSLTCRTRTLSKPSSLCSQPQDQSFTHSCTGIRPVWGQKSPAINRARTDTSSSYENWKRIQREKKIRRLKSGELGGEYLFGAGVLGEHIARGQSERENKDDLMEFNINRNESSRIRRI